MKIKILVVLICMGAACVSAQETHLDIKVPYAVENNLFGAVKSTETTYKEQKFSGDSSRQTETEEVCTYDSKGNLLLEITTAITDAATNRVVYSYDPNGCLTGEVVDESGEGTNAPVRKEFEFSIDVASRQILRRDLKTGEFQVTVYSAGYEHYIEKRKSGNTLTEAVQINRLPNHKEYEMVTFDGETNKTETSQMRWNIHGLQQEYSFEKHGTNGYVFITRYFHPEKDAMGNWTRRVARTELIEEGRKEAYSEEIAVRKIEYFE